MRKLDTPTVEERRLLEAAGEVELGAAIDRANVWFRVEAVERHITSDQISHIEAITGIPARFEKEVTK